MEKHSAQAGIVLFDGVCNLCSASVQFILKRDPGAQLQFAAQQTSVGEKLMKSYGLQTGTPESVVLIEGGRAYTESDAALRIARRLSGLWPLLAVLWVIPRPLRDVVYRFIARNRYRWFGQKDHCMMPTPALRSRFLDDASSAQAVET